MCVFIGRRGGGEKRGENKAGRRLSARRARRRDGGEERGEIKSSVFNIRKERKRETRSDGKELERFGGESCAETNKSRMDGTFGR